MFTQNHGTQTARIYHFLSLCTCTMGDGGWDPCECICSHNGAMRRLLSLLQQAQSSCTDNQCFGTDTVPDPAGGSGMGMWAIVLLWLVLALLLYLFRPASMRRTAGKPVGNDSGDDEDDRPPVPPVQ
ncbi:small integral membrane protein 14-like [Oscarella lobularis]|uniref:small integral membrane protein 14-like n=1 Tax=Oscarella lobularis TaxID=121494 RepID=UPI0033131A97